MVGIYKIKNIVNGKIYIGQSVNIDKRFQQHRSNYKNPNSKQYECPLYEDMRKYGIENFDFEAIEECAEEELDEKEIYYIKYFQSLENGYNRNAGGKNAVSYLKLSDEMVDEIIEKLKTSKDNSDVIGKEFGVCGRTIRAINSGESYHREEEEYPIRKPLYFTENSGPHYCIRCGVRISTNSTYCVSCGHEIQRKAERPSPIELAKMVNDLGFVKTGEEFGLSCNAIRKWCKRCGIPHHKKDIVNWYKQQMM